MSTYRSSSNRSTRRPARKNSSGDGLSLLLYYILPFLVFNGILFFLVTSSPKCTLTIGETHDYLTTEVTLTVNSRFPTKEISLAMDSEVIELEKVRGRTYKATVVKNGTLEATITNLNKMSISQFEHVNVLDDNLPSVDFYNVEDGILTVTFLDSQSGVNPDTIYALDSLGAKIPLLSLDRATATAAFQMDSAGTRVYAQDMAGNEVEKSFTSHKEGDEEILHTNDAETDEEATEALELELERE